MPGDLHRLPKVRDSLTFLYLEKCIVEQDSIAIVAIQGEVRTPIPVAALTVLMLGPGVSITHAAIKTIADCGCSIVWCGEECARFYAFGQSETRNACNLLRQAELCMDEKKHMEVVRRMYELRFPGIDTGGMPLQQIRGLEGIRVREAYRAAAKATGVKWAKRDYKAAEWDAADEINRALSYANTVLYALCQGCIVSLGYSTGLGFIHTGKMLSFVYDIADLYKAVTTIPAAFSAVSVRQGDLEKQVRIECRRFFRAQKLLSRIPKDIAYILGGQEDPESPLITGDLWTGMNATVAGGKNYAEEVR